MPTTEEPKREFVPITRKGITKQYETVASRVRRFRWAHPISSGWGVDTRVVYADAERCRLQVRITDPEKRIIGCGTAEEVWGSSKVNKTSALENCETSALGRALASCGYAGDEYASADELAGVIAQGGGIAQPAYEPAPTQTPTQTPTLTPQIGSAWAAVCARMMAVEHPPCPKCGGPTWDNRGRIAKKEGSPRRPWFACQDKAGCNAPVWAPDWWHTAAADASVQDTAAQRAAEQGATPVPPSFQEAVALDQPYGEPTQPAYADDEIPF